jgi:hemerythrin superfamily protein
MSEPTGTDSPTVIDEIQKDHREIEALLDRVASGAGEDRRAAFDDLARHLAMHEAAEQAVVRPEMERVDPEEAEHREAEESTADEMIERLRAMDVDTPEFDALFTRFRGAVLDHATHEETEEHPELEANVSPQRLVEMAEQFTQAEEQASGR